MREYLKEVLNDSTKLFNFYVLLVLSIVTIPITLNEAFEKEVKYYQINIEGFPLEEIATYQLSIPLIFVIFLVIIHGNRLLLIAANVISLLVPWLEQKLGIIKVQQSQTQTSTANKSTPNNEVY